LEVRETSSRREIERLENLKMETIREKEEILRHRRRIEELVAQSGELQDKQIVALAEVYGSMRPEEAAPILLSLKDALVVRILKKIPEARSASKLIAALGSLDLRRAARITELMGKAPVPAPAAPAAGKAPAPAKKPETPKAPAPAPAAPAPEKTPVPNKA
jgi:flagellar motility protein MotE (MotC chaperone)